MLEVWLLYYYISLKKMFLNLYPKSLPSVCGGVFLKKNTLALKYNGLWICMNSVFLSVFCCAMF